MSKFFHRQSGKAGQAPGQAVFTGRQKVDRVRVTFMDYSPDHLDESADADLESCLGLHDADSTTWLNVYGLHDETVLGRIGEKWNLHPLVQEDVVNTHQRPKVEDYGDYLYIVCRMVRWDERTHQIDSEQISIILAGGDVLTFQEKPGDVFAGVRERLRKGKGRIRGAGGDYLAYALLDSVVDHYFVVLETFADRIEDLEEDLLSDPREEQLQEIHKLKREMILARRAVQPMREVLRSMLISESKLIGEQTVLFLRDVHDHIIQVTDAVDSFRDLLGGLQDLYLSSVSHRMNEVMKVLTIAATIFVPLTFVAGIYGMNFEWMPELRWKWSYPALWVFFIVAGGGMVALFRRKKWL
jgi:magnesium transporter